MKAMFDSVHQCLIQSKLPKQTSVMQSAFVDFVCRYTLAIYMHVYSRMVHIYKTYISHLQFVCSNQFAKASTEICCICYKAARYPSSKSIGSNPHTQMQVRPHYMGLPLPLIMSSSVESGGANWGHRCQVVELKKPHPCGKMQHGAVAPPVELHGCWSPKPAEAAD